MAEDIETLAQNFIEGHNRGLSFVDTQENFPFGFSLCIKQIAESGNRELFRRVVESYVSYSQKVNEGLMEPALIVLEALSFIELQCMKADTGRMTLGIPGEYRMRQTRTMFLDIYSGQLAEDKGYKVTHSIRL